MRSEQAKRDSLGEVGGLGWLVNAKPFKKGARYNETVKVMRGEAQHRKYVRLEARSGVCRKEVVR